MNKTYMMEIDNSLDTLQQSFKSMQFSMGETQYLRGIKDKEVLDCQDIHDVVIYEYDDFDRVFGQHIENIHLYNAMAFVKYGRDKQVRPEIFITAEPVPGVEMTSLSYSNYGLQDYINLVARLRSKLYLRADDRAYRDLIYRQFLSFHINHKVNPFNSIEEFFAIATADVLSSITVIGETQDLWCFKTYKPVFKDHAINKMNAAMKAAFGRDRLGLREQYLKIKNFDHFDIIYTASVKNVEKREFRPEEVDNAEVVGYYQGIHLMHVVEYGQHVKKEDSFFEEVFRDNAYEEIMHEFVEQTKLHLVTA